MGNVRCLADTGHSQFRLRSLDGQVDGYQFMWRSVEITEKLIFELWFYDIQIQFMLHFHLIIIGWVYLEALPNF